jgi:hypothetical protein
MIVCRWSATVSYTMHKPKEGIRYEKNRDHYL